MEENLMEPASCPHCGAAMRSDVVKTAMWQGERMFVVEDIPAQICDSCREQFYDEEVTDRLRRFAEEGAPFADLKGEMLIPVYSLNTQSTPAMATSEE
jgi:YgiT-type zinc finger domain-containing protein